MSKNSSNYKHTATDASNCVFDEQDANLFFVEDKNLKARAIRCSIIPRLLELANAAIAEAAELYGVEPLEIATVAYSPYTAESRGRGFKVDFSAASAGLAPVRRKGAYPLLGRDRMIFISGLSFFLSDRGLQVMLRTDCHNGACRAALFEFFQRHECEIMPLVLSVLGEAHIEGPKPPVLHVFPCAMNRKAFLSAKRCIVYFLSRQFKYPIDEYTIQSLKRAFILMYPVFHATCLLAMGREGEFDLGDAMEIAITFHQEWFEQRLASDPVKKGENAHQTLAEDLVEEIADKRIHVMPGKRWQVFERDGWRCVSCGKSADDGAMLEVDHICPRSRGGSDDIANLQTLCRECNIGKSNKNQTDLRSKQAKQTQNKRCL